MGPDARTCHMLHTVPRAYGVLAVACNCGICHAWCDVPDEVDDRLGGLGFRRPRVLVALILLVPPELDIVVGGVINALCASSVPGSIS